MELCMMRFPKIAFSLLIVTLSASLTPVQATQSTTASAEAAESGEQELVLIEKANRGDANAAFNLGYTYYTQQNYPGAIRWYGKAAELGNARAAFEIAIIYRDGLQGKPDMKKMISYLQQAAKQGLVLAQTELAVSYLQGTGVDKNQQTAMYWYEQAAKQGDAEAQYYLSHLYWNNTQDSQDGFMDSDGQSYRVTADGVTIKIDPRYESNDKKAVYWLCQAAEQNYGDAQLELSQLYGHEWGTRSGDIIVNIKQRDLWLQKAADNGVEQAKQELANNMNVPWYTAAEKWAKGLFEPTEQATCPYDASVLQ